MLKFTHDSIEKEAVLKVAVFHENVKTYIFLIVLGFLVVSIVGWVIVPFWLLGLGQWLSKKYFHTLSCQLTTKNLQFGKGIIFHIEKTIPLENIQDLSFYGGPILRALGLTLIRIETAGGGGKHNSSVMSILGIIGAEEFKHEILNQREVVKRDQQIKGTDPATEVRTSDMLDKIHSELVAIKNVLQSKV